MIACTYFFCQKTKCASSYYFQISHKRFCIAHPIVVITQCIDIRNPTRCYTFSDDPILLLDFAVFLNWCLLALIARASTF